MKKKLLLLLAALVCLCTAAQAEDYNTALFTSRDFDTSCDESKSAVITLSGETASSSSNAASVSGGQVTITSPGTFILRGELTNGMVIVSVRKDEKVHLVLDGASIHSETSAALYVHQADKVFLTLADGTENSLSSGESFVAIDEQNIDAALYARDDLTLNGSGSLTLSSPAGHGLAAKDDLMITGGSYTITSASHGVDANDSISIHDASMTIVSGKDGLHAENNDDASLGVVYIENGSYAIEAQGDGISAAHTLQIQNGTFALTCGGGSQNASVQVPEGWGQFGGGRGGFGGPGGRRGGFGGMGGRQTSASTESTESLKGLKAGGSLFVNGGVFTIDTADDAVHSNNAVTVNGGTFAIASGDDGFHADETLTITGGQIVISQSYEGLEGLHVLLTGGDVTLTASDDGVNAAGGADESGFGGPRGRDRFGTSSSQGSIVISGGTLTVNASGDGIDANGTLEITGGCTTVCGPTRGDTATLDYDSSATISGGVFIGTGAYGMAQTFNGGSQGVIAVSVGNQNAGTEIMLADAYGKAILRFTPPMDYAVAILSSPEIEAGKTYTLNIGSASAQIEAQ